MDIRPRAVPLDRNTGRAFVLAVPVAVLLLLHAGRGAETDFELAAAAGADTTDVFARVGSGPIHCRDTRDAPDCLAVLDARGADDVVLWLGNSQLHSLNQYREGERSSTDLLHASLRPLGRDLVTFSQPNADLEEHLTLFAYLAPRLPLTTLVLPVVFDDMRETGLRPQIAALLDDPDTRASLGASAVGRTLLARERRDVGNGGKDTLDGQAPTGGSWQSRSESALDAVLGRASALWGRRAELRAKTVFALYNIRNTVLGISASTARRLIPAHYEANLAALRATLELAVARDVEVLLYIAPIRGDVELPYVPGEYAAFVETVSGLAAAPGAEPGVRFLDLGSLVPPGLWGATASATVAGNARAEIDFMHFRASGHMLLAERLLEELERNGAAPPRSSR